MKIQSTIPWDRYRLTFPGRVIFGWGSCRQVPELAAQMGRRAWIVSGSRTLSAQGVIDRLCDALAQAGVHAEQLTTISREPSVEDVDKTTADLLDAGLRSDDLMVGIGGGSALDLAKAVSAMATNRHGQSVLDFLEGVGRGLTIDVPPLPMLAIPTTAGTGTEATRNAVISSEDPPFKKSLRSERMVPQTVVIDPEWTLSCPRQVTAHSGMDAVTQLIESYISRRSHALTAALCLEGLQRAIPALPRLMCDARDQTARSAMSHAAFLSGVALANSGLGMAHGVAAALGIHCGIPHGLACAVMLPVALDANRVVAQSRLATLERALTQEPIPSEAEAAQRFIRRILDLRDEVGIPRTLAELGVKAEQISTIAAASRGNSMNGNPRVIEPSELEQILHHAWGGMDTGRGGADI